MMKKNKTTGWRGVIRNYPKSNFVKSCKKAGVSAILTITLICFLMDLTQTLKLVLEFIISTIPTILGFTLAALALFFSVAINFERLFFRNSKEKSSLFQEVQATFGVIILVMVFTLIASFIVNLCLSQSIDASLSVATTTNIITLFIMLFLLYYTLFSILDVTINLLNLGQYIQAVFDGNQEETQEDNSFYKGEGAE